MKLEWEPSFNEMTDEQRGIMLKVFFDYHKGRELDFKGDTLVKCLWLNIFPNIKNEINKQRVKELFDIRKSKKKGNDE